MRITFAIFAAACATRSRAAAPDRAARRRHQGRVPDRAGRLGARA
jgi:hypothetical protein